jgi:prevent-host-death family protein
MERIGIEEVRKNLSEIINSVEIGKEFMITRHGKDVALISSPERDEKEIRHEFLTRINELRKQSTIKNLTPEEMKVWIEEGRE